MRHMIFLTLLLFSAVASAKIKVIASTTVLKSLVESVGGSLVEVTSIARGTEDPHFVEVRPSFMMSIQNAKLYVSTGMSLDHWARSLIESSRNTGIVNINASKGIRVLGLPTERVTALMGDVHPEGNPHYWVDPYQIPVVVKNILSGLVSVDANNEKAYQKNAKTFLDALKKSTATWEKRLAPFKGVKVVTFHESWEYFADRFHLDVVAQVEPKPGIPPSGAHTEEVIQKMKREKVRIIIMEPFYSDATPKLIAEKTGAKVVKIPQLCEGTPHTASYMELLEYDVSELEKALK